MAFVLNLIYFLKDSNLFIIDIKHILDIILIKLVTILSECSVYFYFMAPRRIELRTPPRERGILPLDYEANYMYYNN